MQHRSYYIINGITLYRLVAAPFLAVLLVMGKYDLFKWMLAISFFTDTIDGFLARQFRVTSVFGSRVDSIADDLTMAVAIAGAIVFKPEFLRQEIAVIAVLLVLFLVQVVSALIRYRRLTSFHTYGAKGAMILQGVFFILFFFVDEPLYGLFYAAVAMTAIDLIEEIILVWILPQWQTDVKGIYWVLKRRPVSTGSC